MQFFTLLLSQNFIILSFYGSIMFGQDLFYILFIQNAKKRKSNINLNDCLINLLSNMKPTPLRLESSERSGRATSLPNKIKIRTCKLPKDFFRDVRVSSDALKTSRVSRKSTCDDDITAPSTPSFRIEKDSREKLRSSRKNETTRIRSPIKLVDFLPCRERTQNLRKRINRELKERFVAFELPPIYSNRVSLEL